MAACLILFTMSAAQATIIFSDNFDVENNGSGSLNYFGFQNWTVSNGSVDLIGPGLFDLLPGNGFYVDMDGSTGDAGKLTTTNSFARAAGTYQLSFELAGNQRARSQEEVMIQVNMGSLVNESISLGTFDPFTYFAFEFTLASATSVSLSFEGVGNDNVGMLLDDVVLESLESTSAPEPLSLLLMGLGLAGLSLRRKI